MRLSPLLLLCFVPALAQVSYKRILNSESEPGNWLTYSGNYYSQRYSTLDQINRENVANLRVTWMYQVRAHHKLETSPLEIGRASCRERV